MWSRTFSSCAAVIEYTGGSVNTFPKPLGGYNSDGVSTSCFGEGGDVSGVLSKARDDGRGPGEQKGMCLFGMAAGVPRWDVLMLIGGVAVLVGTVVTVVVHAIALVLVRDRSFSTGPLDVATTWRYASFQPSTLHRYQHSPLDRVVADVVVEECDFLWRRTSSCFEIPNHWQSPVSWD